MKNKQDEIDRVHEKVAELEEKKTKLIHRRDRHEIEAEKWKDATHNVVSFVPQEFQRRVVSFMEGWVHWLISNKKTDDFVAKTKLISDTFLNNVISSPSQHATSEDDAA